MPGSLARRSGPEGLLSDEATMNNTTAVNVKYNSNNLSGCHLYSVIITDATGAASVSSATTLSIMSASTVLTTIMITQSATLPVQTVFAFPAPIPVDGNLKVKCNKNGNKFKVRCLVQTY